MSDRLLDIPAVREHLGGLGRTTVFELIRTGELGSVKIGRRRMVPASQVDAYIARRLDLEGARVAS